MIKDNGQDKRNGHIEQEGLGSVKEKSRSTWNESDKVIDIDCKRSNHNEPSRIRRRREITGGILSQLTKDTEDQLAFSKKQISYYENQIKSLEKKLVYLKGLEVFYMENENKE